MLKTQHEPSFILHKRNYRESSLLLDVFSREHGRLNLVAKGAKRNKKHQSVSFELYQPYAISWISKTDLGTLTDIEAERHTIKLDSKQIYFGFYMNELIINLLHKHEPHPELFDAYHHTLVNFSIDKDAEKTLRYFEKNLLQSLGYGLVLTTEIETGEDIQPHLIYFYRLDMGPQTKAEESDGNIKISGKTLLQLDSENLQDTEQLREARQLCRAVLSRYLGNKKLKSRELYNAFINAGTSA